MRGSTKTTACLVASLLSLGAAASAQAACTRQVINRTPHVVVASQDGGPSFTVQPRRSRTIRYVTSGRVDIAVHCRAPARGLPLGPPAHAATFDTTAILDRCFVDIDGGGHQPVTLNNPRQGDIVVAPYGLACP
ncbi:MAG TPA: hypothetical protein VF641_02460 [Methylobacterium sp.]|jgi:hypothetical protein